MANGIRRGHPRGFNKGRSSKFREVSRVRQTPEEGRRTYRPKELNLLDYLLIAWVGQEMKFQGYLARNETQPRSGLNTICLGPQPPTITVTLCMLKNGMQFQVMMRPYLIWVVCLAYRKKKLATRVQNLDETVRVSLRLGKGMNLYLLLQLWVNSRADFLPW